MDNSGSNLDNMNESYGESILKEEQTRASLFSQQISTELSATTNDVSQLIIAQAPESGQSNSGGLVVSVQSQAVPTDPLLSNQWHLDPAEPWDINVQSVWQDYTGSGVIVGVIDTGFDYNHVDLAPNYRLDLDYDVSQDIADAMYVDPVDDRHGTAVMGLIGADDNGVGTVGVAFDADLVGYRKEFGSVPLSDTTEALTRALSDGVDILNNSWSYTNLFSDNFSSSSPGWQAFSSAVTALAESGRGGLGSIIVNSAGNYRHIGHDANYHNFQNSPYTIAVGAMRIIGEVPSYSNPGANLLVTAPGASLDTTDISGADGYNTTDYYSAFGGTSASAPVLSGVIALMLEANSNLGYRDVQEIIAYSAIQNDPLDTSWAFNGAGNWNGGGLHFSHDYGFGLIDAHKAVRLAENWDLQQTFANTISVSADYASSQGLVDLGTITTTLDIVTDIEIEHVLLHVDITHSKIGDLSIVLISPDGTESYMMTIPEKGDFIGTGSLDFVFSSTAHWGEMSAGTWTLRIEDHAAGNTGTLNSWDLEFLGNSSTTDDLYIFTDELSNFSGTELAARSIINENDGGTDVINLSTLVSASTVNLANGTGTIAGQAITISLGAGDSIEKVIGGDGNDVFIGDNYDNTLFGGRGDDSLEGGAGNDTLDGGAGIDTAIFSSFVDDFTFNFLNPNDLIITHLSSSLGTDNILNIENFQFTDVTFTRAALEDHITQALINGTAGHDNISGNDYINEIYGDLGNDQIYGGAGDDIIYGEDGNDRIYGEGGNDLIYGGENQDFLYGGDGNDTMHGGLRVDELRGGAGDDVLYGDDQNDKLWGDEGADNLNGGNGHDLIYGGLGNDTINGDGGVDTIYGGDGIDTINGGLSNDHLHGEANDDIINGNDGQDFMYGGEGSDTLNGGAHADVLNGGNGNDILDGGTHNDVLNGDAGNDNLSGGRGADTLNGGDDNDTLYGNWGSDNLNGGAGDDTLYGYSGLDTLTGGAGADRFVFEYGQLNQVDVVTDYNTLENDIIDLSDVLSYDFLSDVISDFVRITDDGTDSFLEIDANGGADSFTLIVTLEGITGITDEVALEVSGGLIG
jgi:Ca2+-binding RTX toxin-like protein/subtilisin-like proprotein convertase family protein